MHWPINVRKPCSPSQILKIKMRCGFYLLSWCIWHIYDTYISKHIYNIYIYIWQNSQSCCSRIFFFHFKFSPPSSCPNPQSRRTTELGLELSSDSKAIFSVISGFLYLSTINTWKPDNPLLSVCPTSCILECLAATWTCTNQLPVAVSICGSQNFLWI